MKQQSVDHQEHIVIVGGGFGGLYAAQALKNAPIRITLIDKRNFHLFQPLLYQVATGGLSPGDIASPLRAILKRQKNVSVIKAEVVDIDPDRKKLCLRDGDLDYDTLIVATGVSHHYFGNDQWADRAPGLKTIEDALEIRKRILSAFEVAEREPDPAVRQSWLTFVIVGAGPTGVELAGALAELAHTTLKNDFSHIDPKEAQIILLEGAERVLPPYPAQLSGKAEAALEKLGVTVRSQAMVTDLADDRVTVSENGKISDIHARTILWAAGMKASAMGETLSQRTGVQLDQAGRVKVNPNLSIADYADIFVIGDLAHLAGKDGSPLPGVAPVAMQQGKYVAELIKKRLSGGEVTPFKYFDKGNLAVIGRNAAVADVGSLKFAGFPAWLAWLFIHLWFLIEFDNKLIVLFQWAWNYITRKRGARLITTEEPSPSVLNIPASNGNGTMARQTEEFRG